MLNTPLKAALARVFQDIADLSTASPNQLLKDGVLGLSSLFQPSIVEDNVLTLGALKNVYSVINTLMEQHPYEQDFKDRMWDSERNVHYIKPVPDGYVRLREQGYRWLVEQLAKLEKKALKLGTTPPALELLSKETVEETISVPSIFPGEYDRETVSVTYFTVQVTGAAPVLNGWSLSAVLEHTEAGNLVKAFPTFKGRVEERFHTTDSKLCEHCGTKRYRKDTFIVQDADGAQKQVGRNCLKDFTGHANPTLVANMALYITGLVSRAGSDEDFGPRYREVIYTDLQVLLTQVTAVARIKGGFVSKAAVTKAFESDKDSGLRSTGVVTQELMYPPAPYGSNADKEADRRYQEEQRALFAPTEKDAKFAADAIAWAKGLVYEGNDYLWNLHVIAGLGEITFKNWGIACSLAQAYCNHVKKERAAAKALTEAAYKPVSTHVGTVNTTVNLLLKVEYTKAISSMYGDSILYVMLDEAGNKYKWFCSGKALQVELDTPVHVKATIKGHEVYKEEKYTQLTRVKHA